MTKETLKGLKEKISELTEQLEKYKERTINFKSALSELFEISFDEEMEDKIREIAREETEEIVDDLQVSR